MQASQCRDSHGAKSLGNPDIFTPCKCNTALYYTFCLSKAVLYYQQQHINIAIVSQLHSGACAYGMPWYISRAATRQKVATPYHTRRRIP